MTSSQTARHPEPDSAEEALLETEFGFGFAVGYWTGAVCAVGAGAIVDALRRRRRRRRR